MTLIRHCVRVILCIVAGLAILGLFALGSYTAGRIARDALHDEVVR
jgi:hypothetical protein